MKLFANVFRKNHNHTIQPIYDSERRRREKRKLHHRQQIHTVQRTGKVHQYSKHKELKTHERLVDRKLVEALFNFIAGRPKAALLFWSLMVVLLFDSEGFRTY